MRRIRVKKEKSAYVYALLESHEGWTAYSTLPSPEGAKTCDLELAISPDFVQEVDELLHELFSQGDWIDELP